MNVPEVKRRARGIPRNRRRIVTVIGSGRSADAHSGEVGHLIATLGADLLTGGGGGVMEAASRAFFETSPRHGLVMAVVPGRVRPLRELEERNTTDVEYELSSGYPNKWVELAIYTHLPDSGVEGTLGSSRNHINVLSADAIVALPGQEGTESEVWLATQYKVPLIAYGAYGDHPVPHGIPHAPTLDALREFLVRHIKN